MNIRLFVILAGLGLSFVANGNSQIPLNKTITEVHAYSTGVTFTYSPVSTGSYNCSGAGATYAVHIDWTADPDLKILYSVALAAYTSGKQVGFGVDGCVAGYGGDVPKIYRIDVK